MGEESGGKAAESWRLSASAGRGDRMRGRPAEPRRGSGRGGASWARVCACTSPTRPTAFPVYAEGAGCSESLHDKSKVAGRESRPPPRIPQLHLSTLLVLGAVLDLRAGPG